MTSSLGGFPEIHTSRREAPASISSRTVSIQSPGLPACSPLPTVAKASGVPSNLASRASTSAPAARSSPTTAAFPW